MVELFEEYKYNPLSILKLKDYIIRLIGNIKQNVMENDTKSMSICEVTSGSHLLDVSVVKKINRSIYIIL